MAGQLILALLAVAISTAAPAALAQPNFTTSRGLVEPAAPYAGDVVRHVFTITNTGGTVGPVHISTSLNRGFLVVLSLRELSLGDWAAMSEEVARRECESLTQSLPAGLTLTDLAMHEYCGRSHRVARFSTREASDLVHFVLAPGGEVSLGFDGRDFKPSRPDQIVPRLAVGNVAPRLRATAREILDP